MENFLRVIIRIRNAILSIITYESHAYLLFQIWPCFFGGSPSIQISNSVEWNKYIVGRVREICMLHALLTTRYWEILTQNGTRLFPFHCKHLLSTGTVHNLWTLIYDWFMDAKMTLIFAHPPTFRKVNIKIMHFKSVLVIKCLMWQGGILRNPSTYLEKDGIKVINE